MKRHGLKVQVEGMIQTIIQLNEQIKANDIIINRLREKLRLKI
jgi:hypothetical protein